MKRLFLYPYILIMIIMASGCATVVKGTKKMDGYDKKLSSLSVMWQNNPTLSFQIRKTAGLAVLATITEGNKDESRKNLGALMGMLVSQSSGAVSDKLRAKGVSVITLANDSPTSPKGLQHLIKVYPDFAGSECSAISCSHNAGLLVTVWDFDLKKTVWQGDFKVGAPLGGEVTNQLLTSFLDSLISELQKSQLLQ